MNYQRDIVRMSFSTKFTHSFIELNNKSCPTNLVGTQLVGLMSIMMARVLPLSMMLSLPAGEAHSRVK